VKSVAPSFTFPKQPVRRANEAIERAEAALADVKQNPLAGTYVRDTLSGGLWSPEVFEIFGWEKADQAPALDDWAPMLSRADYARVLAAARQAHRDRQPFDAHYSIQLRNGARKLLHSRALPVYGQFGRDFALVGIVTDITAEARVQAALRAAAKELRRTYAIMDGGETGTDADGGLKDSAADNSFWKVARGGMSPFKLRRVLRLIDERLPAKMSVAEMAREAGLSATWFARVFKHVTGDTPHQFLLRQRLDRANTALLNRSDKTLAQIAVEFGFVDQAHFTRHFRRKFGTTPGELLRQVSRLRR
jgi:AraC-like DNA-binding protein